MSRAPAEARLGRLLAVVPWVAARDGPTLEEVSRRFGVEEKELVEDLNLLFMCGVYPFTPDVLIDVHIADGRVWISMADYFRRPLRLNAQEGLALAAAASTLVAVPGSDSEGALGTALDKLRNVLGVAADDALDIELGPAPAVLDTLRAASRDHRKVRIDYYSFGRDGHSTRVIHPWRVFNSAGQWYAAGWCEMVDAQRVFRADRITGATVMDDQFDPPPVDPAGAAGAVYHPAEGDLRIVLDLQPPAHWIAEQYPNEDVTGMPGDVLRVTLRSSGRAWLERLLLRAGPYASVVEGDATIASAAARRVLSRYRQ